MVGADEYVICNQYGQSIFVTRGPGAEKAISDYLKLSVEIGFTVKNGYVEDIRAAHYKNYIRKYIMKKNHEQ